MKPKETNARIIIDKMLLEAEWKLPGYVKDHEINVETEIINKFGEADYVLLSTKENHLCTVEAKNHSKSPLVGKEQARDYANSLKCRFIILSNGFDSGNVKSPYAPSISIVSPIFNFLKAGETSPSSTSALTAINIINTPLNYCIKKPLLERLTLQFVIESSKPASGVFPFMASSKYSVNS